MFTDLIQQRFRFLVDEYGFVAARADHDIVEYVSQHCHVMVVVDRGYVAITLRSTGPEIERRARLTLEEILRARDPTFQFEHQYDVHKFPIDRIGTVDAQLKEQARLLRERCDEVLRGDFSIRQKIEAISGEYVWEEEVALREEINPVLRRLRGESES